MSHLTHIQRLLIEPEHQESASHDLEDEFGLVKALFVAVPASLIIMLTGVLGIFLGDIVELLLGL